MIVNVPACKIYNSCNASCCRPMSNSTGTENPSVRPKSHVKSASLTQSQVARVTDLPPLSDGDNFRPT